MDCDETLDGFCNKLKAAQNLIGETLNERDNRQPRRLANKIGVLTQNGKT
jgi:hypothetical protein